MSHIPHPNKKPWYKRTRVWLLVLVVVLILIGIRSGMRAGKQAEKKKYEYLEQTVKVQKKTLKRTVAGNGIITPDQSTLLSFSLSGNTEEILKKKGDEVKKDEVLIKIDSDIPSSSSAREIKSPFDGKITDLMTFTGDIIKPGEPVIEVSYRTNHVQFFASESEVVHLHSGQSASLTFPAYEKGREIFSGKVLEVAIKKENTSGAATGGTDTNGYPVTISMGNVPQEVRDILGLSVDIEIETDKKIDVLSLEPGAIQYTDDNETFIYLPPQLDDEFFNEVRGKDDITEFLERKTITIGFEGDEYTEVTEGLREGEKVLLSIPTK